jgi:hypothetical protein
MDALEQKYTSKLLEITKAFFSIVVAKMNELNIEQNRLNLEEIFSPGALLSKEELARSRSKLSKLVQLLGEHKSFYSKYMVRYQKETLSLGSELPESRQMELTKSAAESVQIHLNEQAYFFTLREQWIISVSKLLDLFQNQDDSISHDGESFILEDNGELETFVALCKEIDELAQKERKLLAVRVQRMQQNMGTLRVTLS